MTAQVVLATRNAHKLVELERILAEARLPVELLGLGGFPQAPEVVESEDSFLGNATLKAVALREHTGLPTIADDSGLCVDALNGMPGILSARWCGRHGDDRANLELVLGQLADTPDERLTAQFTCAAVVAWPDGSVEAVHGRMDGRLVRQPRGTNGFGYDPIFVPDGLTVTSAELSDERKDVISHRGRALRALVPLLVARLG